MGLNKTIEDLVGVVRSSEDKKTKAYDTMATVTRIEGSTAWVHIPGGVDETPVQLTVSAEPGDTVQVRVGGGTAWITGNASAPPTDDRTANAALGLAEASNDNANKAVTEAMQASLNALNAVSEAGDAKKVATNYLSVDNTGIMVADMTDGVVETPSEATTRNVFIDSDSVDIRDGQTVLASFGETAQIGGDNHAHIILDDHSVQMIDAYGDAYLSFRDLRDRGVATITETFTGDGATTQFTVELSVYATVSATDSRDPTNTATLSSRTYTFATAPAHGSVVTIIYTTTSVFAKVFTIGSRYRSANVGPMSVSFGENISATGYASVGEGVATRAFGTAAHSEGSATTASGRSSHAEGSGSNASGAAAHAEGRDTSAGGQYAHAGGYQSSANGICSFAHGARARAQSDGQTVFGTYNEVDGNEVYCFIIGNGTSDSARSDALALTWDGNPLLGLAPFQPTSDTVIDSTKTYYQYDFLEEKYVVVTNPDVSEIESYYELTGTDGDLYAAVAALGWESEVID